ncbi:tetratricopeptide repeat protein [Lactococcus lactis]|uniref:tetratricopeptide repeat protein n=1 Tax=Lactococcus lactis TaxID=1358 RepID=UPI00070B3152|nr:tetratricopeptide repeat protein [Lactococcus lactis]KRO23550.1 hypothetical protein IV65_GL001474 [Lactococcus lactis subsp. lactis]
MSYSEDTIDFLHQGDLIGMQNSLAKALKNDNSEMLADLAEYLQMMGFIDESQKIYDQIMSEDPETTDYLINLAEIAEDNGNLDEALNYLYQIPVNDENYIAALVKIADLYQFEGDFETAISKLEEARELSDSPLITFALAESYFEQGDYSAAITEYAKLSERKILHETKISIYQRIGDSYAQLGNFENAISFLEKSLEFDEKPETLYKIALLYGETHNETRAIANFKRLEKMDVEFLNYELAYAQTLEANQEFEAALEMAKKGMKKNPNAVPLLAKWLFAGAHKALENDSEAAALYEELIQTNLSENPEFLEDYIDFLKEIGQISKTEPIIEQYLELVPDDENMRNLLTDLKNNY